MERRNEFLIGAHVINPLLFLLLLQFSLTQTGIISFKEIDQLFRDIYSGRVAKKLAHQRLERYHRELRAFAERTRSQIGTGILFPLKGYSRRDVGGSNGRSYIDSKSFDFFDGNRHKGHPALDIFIHDRNQDCIDDRTEQAVAVLAVTDGVILSVQNVWSSDSLDARGNIIRGGKYLFLFSPKDDALWYYAHLNSILVKPGDTVFAGREIGTVGRTGANAMQKRSDTHLHLMYLRWQGEKLIPENPFPFFR